jgi:outer membrane protein assembly factor BamA
MLRSLITLLFVVGAVASALGQKHVVFERNVRISTSDLESIYNACVTKASQPNEHARNYCVQHDLQKYIWSLGYLNAQITSKKNTPGESQLITIEEGPRYRLGNVEITGSKAFTPQQLREMLNLKTGDIADGKEITDWTFGKITNLYGDEGYVQSNTEFEPIFRHDPANPYEGIADLKVTVEEGRQFVIQRIQFDGNVYVRDRVLKDAMVTKEGDIFSQKMFDESIQKLNQLGLFERIDKDTDVTIMVDDKKFDVNITVRVEERGKTKP